MPRMLLGSLAAAVAMFITGFVFFGSPLGNLAYGGTSEGQQAAIQLTLSQNLPETGTYQIPRADQSAATTVMYGKGPVATIHYNSKGFAATSNEQLLFGFLQEFIAVLLMGFALLGIAGRVLDFASRARLVALFSLSGAVLMNLGEPIWNHHDWGHFIYLFVGDTAMLVIGGLIIARWFLPRADQAGVSP